MMANDSVLPAQNCRIGGSNPANPHFASGELSSSSNSKALPPFGSETVSSTLLAARSFGRGMSGFQIPECGVNCLFCKVGCLDVVSVCLLVRGPQPQNGLPLGCETEVDFVLCSKNHGTGENAVFISFWISLRTTYL